MPGFPVHDQLPELTQTRVYWVGDVVPFSSYLLSFQESGVNMSLQLLVSSFFQWCPLVFSAEIFHFLRSLFPALLGSSRVRYGEDGLVKRVNFPPSPLYLLSGFFVIQVPWAMPFTCAYKWAPYWEFSLDLSVHLTIRMSTNTLLMLGLSPRAWDILANKWSYQAIKPSAIKNNQNRQFIAFSLSLDFLELNFPM